MKEYFEKVLCSEELPKKDGQYIVHSKCNISTVLESAESLTFKNGKFMSISNWTHLWWLKPVSLEQVKAENEKLKKALGRIYTIDTSFENYINAIVELKQIAGEAIK